MTYERKTYPCADCGTQRTCDWVDDSWVCRRCGSEYADDEPAPESLPGSKRFDPSALHRVR